MSEQNSAQASSSAADQKPAVQPKPPELTVAEDRARQKVINDAEWQLADNWGGPKTLAVYFSKKDSRIWVPQQKPSIGCTLNLAHTGGVLWLVGICVGIIILMVMVTVFIGDLLFSGRLELEM